MSDQSDVAGLLAQLEAEREELDVTITLLRRRLGLAAISDAPSPAGGNAPRDGGRDTPVIVGRVRADEFFRLSIADAITKFLGIMKQPQNPMAIVNRLKAGGVLTNAKNFYANVNTELKRMKVRDLVVNTPSGWGLAEWYPNKPKAVETAKPKKKRKKNSAAIASKALKSGSMAPVTTTAMTWNEFSAAALREGKTMAEASSGWKQIKGGL